MGGSEKYQTDMANLWEQIFKSSGNRLEKFYSMRIWKGKYLGKIKKFAKILNIPQTSF